MDNLLNITPEIRQQASSLAVEDAAVVFREARCSHWNNVAKGSHFTSNKLHACYHNRLREIYRFLVPKSLRVLELGCAEGDLLAALEPGLGLGIDFSSAMLDIARSRHPHLHFIEADAHLLDASINPDLMDNPFDIVILSDLVNDAWDVLELLKRIKALCSPQTRVIINFHSHLWEHPFQILQHRGWVTPRLTQNWFTPDDLKDILDLAGFEVIRHFTEFLCPLQVPILGNFINRFVAKIWPFSLFNLTHFMISRLLFTPQKKTTVSIVIPARSEAGNIESALRRIPELGDGTEIIFVEGNSTDNTWDVIQEAIALHPDRCIKALRQPGKGKGDAVRAGFALAANDILMILDADLTMPPESLPQFYDAIASGKAEFANGVRLVYPQEKEAMRFFNLLGNKFFSLVFSWLLGRNIKDTLCGTKVLRRNDYEKIAANRGYFGEFDPFGDFDLLFGAAKLNLKIMDIPVRYRERTYGETNISRWRDGWILLRMVMFAARRIKFVP